MGDRNRGHAETIVQAADFDLHGFAQLFVQRRKRFVHQQDARFEDDRARQRDALALTAGQLRDPPILITAKLHQIEHLADPLATFHAADTAQLQRIGDVFPDAHMRKEGVILEDHADIALVRRQVYHLLIAKAHGTR